MGNSKLFHENTFRMLRRFPSVLPPLKKNKTPWMGKGHFLLSTTTSQRRRKWIFTWLNKALFTLAPLAPRIAIFEEGGESWPQSNQLVVYHPLKFFLLWLWKSLLQTGQNLSYIHNPNSQTGSSLASTISWKLKENKEKWSMPAVVCFSANYHKWKMHAVHHSFTFVSGNFIIFPAISGVCIWKIIS